MAEEETAVTGNGGNSWWNSWVNTAKSKSAEVFEFVKRDLDEFSSAVKSEATAVVANTTSAFKETLKLDKPESTVSNVKRSFSSFLGQVSNALSPPPDDGDEEAILIQGDSPVLLTRLQTRLYSIYNDTNTFTKEIEDEHEAAFEAWLANLDEHHLSNERLTRLLVCNPVLQQNYESLVPQQISHAQFWKRLLFRKAMVEDEEAARERREERDRQAAESFQWDKEEKLGNHLELSEEEQIRLLQEYENERNGILAKNQSIQQTQETEDTKKEDNNMKLSMREKKDLVIISADQNSSSTSTTSTGDKESNDDDWEREFDLEDENEVVD